MENIQPDMAYTYEMTLSLARPGTPFSDEDRQTLEHAIACYNEKTIYMANPKQIKLLDIADSCIRIELCSTQILATPGRGLRTLTTILLSDPHSPFSDRVTPGGQLFRVFSVKALTSGDASTDPALIPDADFVKALIDYLVERKDGSTACQKKKTALNEMKKIAVGAGIISSTAC